MHTTFSLALAETTNPTADTAPTFAPGLFTAQVNVVTQGLGGALVVTQYVPLDAGEEDALYAVYQRLMARLNADGVKVY
jgi:hypothetical protein